MVKMVNVMGYVFCCPKRYMLVLVLSERKRSRAAGMCHGLQLSDMTPLPISYHCDLMNFPLEKCGKLYLGKLFCIQSNL